MRSLLAFCLLLAACTPPVPEPEPEPDPTPPWPQWAWEHWVWEDESTQESVLTLVDGYLERDIPVSAVIVDSPWATGYNTFDWDPTLFPDPQGLVDDLHDRDVRLSLWITQMVNVDTPQWDEASASGYLMMADADATEPRIVEWWKGDGGLLDYFNPEAVAWWHELMQPVLDLGIDGWKTDGSDFSAHLAPYSPGAGREVGRLEYSHAYYRDFFEHTRQELGEDRIITARPVDNYGADLGGDAVAFAPVDLNWAGWVGDQDADFGGLEAALLNLFWSADYGYVGFGSDIGGYREEDGVEGGRRKEPFLRWAQLGAFCPVMENGGGGRHEPWFFDEEAVSIYRDAVLMHEALLPYLMREGAVAFEEERSLFEFLDPGQTTYRYLLGPDLFVSPIVAEGTSFEVMMPHEGTWRWLYGDGREIEGGEAVTLEVPMESYPAFVRVGSRLEGELLAID
ncbi:MAG: hypothetical protein GY898_27640 [Proteobacteria bacterium]|nr:hypothetical protein [Pseudomonadota bacterium]